MSQSPSTSMPATPVSPTTVNQPTTSDISTTTITNTTTTTSPAATTFPALPVAADDAARQAPRRKPSRRANTAERRATHNAVERQRRETLNGRFLDLAALLPNLASVRRPSKSAIVNSSIALIHSQRRARAIAAQELRILKAETDALRRELNEWRERTHSGPRLEEPVRSNEFVALINLDDVAEENEEERRAYAMRDAIMEEGEDDFGPDSFEDDLRSSYPTAPAIVSAITPTAPIPIPAAAPAAPRFEYTLANQSSDKMAAWNAHIYNTIAQSQWAPQQAYPTQAHSAAAHAAAQLQAQAAAQVQAQQAQAVAAHAAALFTTPPPSAHSPTTLTPFAHQSPMSAGGRSPVGPLFPSYPSAPPTSAHSSVGLIDDDGTSSVGSYQETQTPPRGTPPAHHSPMANVFGGASPFAPEMNGASATSADAFAAAFHPYSRNAAVGPVDWTGANKNQFVSLLM